jgi:hypothetical protein
MHQVGIVTKITDDVVPVDNRCRSSDARRFETKRNRGLYDLNASSWGRPVELEFKAEEIASLPQKPGQRGPPTPKRTSRETVCNDAESVDEVEVGTINEEDCKDTIGGPAVFVRSAGKGGKDGSLAEVEVEADD